MTWEEELTKKWYLHSLTGQGAFTTCGEEVIGFIKSLLKKQRKSCAEKAVSGHGSPVLYDNVLNAPEPG